VPPGVFLDYRLDGAETGTSGVRARSQSGTLNWFYHATMFWVPLRSNLSTSVHRALVAAACDAGLGLRSLWPCDQRASRDRLVVMRTGSGSIEPA
jgi:hypothetical protein